MKRESKTVHWGDRTRAELKVKPPFTPVTTPIYTATSYSYDSMETLDRVFARELDGPSYTRYGNPTVDALEELVRELEGGADCVACASGMAALHLGLIAGLLDRPRHVLCADAIYGSTASLLMNILGPLGIETSFVDICDLSAIRAAVEETKPGVILMETVSNPLLRVGELDKIAAIARSAGAALVVDATFSTPLLIRPLELGAGIVVHSATKYMAGHGDVLGGAVISAPEHAEAVRNLGRTLGPVMSPFESFLTMRGMKTLAIRMERHCANACKVASWLSGHPGVDRVYFTGDPAHTDSATIARLFPKNQTGAMVSFELRGAGREQVFRFMDSLKMIVRGTSLGDVQTLVTYPAMSSHRELTPKHRHRLGIHDNLVRLSIGIEAAEDIIEDLDQALAVTR
jgi:cystathionine beta-lyase/cystathionine gamma-synthase